MIWSCIQSEQMKSINTLECFVMGIESSGSSLACLHKEAAESQSLHWAKRGEQQE